jgi:hypothetical protein
MRNSNYCGSSERNVLGFLPLVTIAIKNKTKSHSTPNFPKQWMIIKENTRFEKSSQDAIKINSNNPIILYTFPRIMTLRSFFIE